MTDTKLFDRYIEGERPLERRVAAAVRRVNPKLRLVVISFSPNFPENLTGLVDGWVSKIRSPDVLLRKIEQLVGRNRSADS